MIHGSFALAADFSSSLVNMELAQKRIDASLNAYGSLLRSVRHLLILIILKPKYSKLLEVAIYLIAQFLHLYIYLYFFRYLIYIL